MSQHSSGQTGGAAEAKQEDRTARSHLSQDSHSAETDSSDLDTSSEVDRASKRPHQNKDYTSNSDYSSSDISSNGRYDRNRTKHQSNSSIREESDSSPRKTKKDDRKRKRRFSHSSSSSSSSEDSSAYEAYEPHSDSDGKWKLNKKIKQYAQDKFTTYIREKKMKKVMRDCPNPDHKFLTSPEFDSDLEEGLETVTGKKASFAKTYDQDLNRIQTKVLRIMGPLGRLLSNLENFRKRKSPSTAELDTFLKLTEQTVLLVGQSNNAILFAWRLNVLGLILKDKGQEKKKLNKYSDLQSTHGKMFAHKFQSKLTESQKSSTGVFSLHKVEKQNLLKGALTGRGQWGQIQQRGWSKPVPA